MKQEVKQNSIRILAIETSCDETAAAVITAAPCECTNFAKVQINPKTDQQINKSTNLKLPTTNYPLPTVLSNIVSSQIDLHAKTGGVVPEVASRAHVESIMPVIEEALREANSKPQTLNSKQIQNNNNQNIKQFGELENSNLDIVPDLGFSVSDLLSEITHIAVTAGPGLIGSLMVGFDTAKSLAYGLNLPIVPVNHIEGHIYSALAELPYESTNQAKVQINPQISNSKLKTQEQVIARDEAIFNNSTIQQFNNDLKFPILALTVSGGHTSLTLMTDHGKYQTIGETLDDAAGEAFDKVAKLLDLGYPGGPAVSKLAEQFRNRNCKKQDTCLPVGMSSTKQITNHKSQIQINYNKNTSNLSTSQHLNSSAVKLPRPMLDRPGYDFSFSGLKTAVLTEVKNRLKNKEAKELKNYKKVIARSEETKQSESNEKIAAPSGLAMTDQSTDDRRLTTDDKQEIAYAFEEAVVDVLVGKTLKAAKKYGPKSVILAGGVAANNRLRERLTEELMKLRTKKPINNINLLVPPINLCGDNAAMIGIAAYYNIVRGDTSSWDKIELNSNMKL